MFCELQINRRHLKVTLSSGFVFLCNTVELGICTKTGWSNFKDIWTVLFRFLSNRWCMCIPHLLCVPIQIWFRKWLEAWKCENLWIRCRAYYFQIQHPYPQWYMVRVQFVWNTFSSVFFTPTFCSEMAYLCGSRIFP